MKDSSEITDIDYPVVFSIAVLDPPFEIVCGEKSYDRLIDSMFKIGSSQVFTIDLPERLVFEFTAPFEGFVQSVVLTRNSVHKIVRELKLHQINK